MSSPDTILIQELDVWYRVGVPDEERERLQRLQLCVEISHSFATAAASDDLSGTIDYSAVTERLLHFGEGRSWRLIETLAVDLAEAILTEFQVKEVQVEVRKFIIPETRYVAVRVRRNRRFKRSRRDAQERLLSV